MRTISLTRGFLALVDDEDYLELSKHKWCVHKAGRAWCAIRHLPTVNGKQHTIYMHQQIVGSRPGFEIDHITHEGEEDGIIDNRRENLRFCTHAQNNANRRKYAGCSSRFKGVYWFKRGQCWRACIRVNGKMKHLGYFDSEEDAARAYDKAAWEAWGEGAWLNFPR